MLTEIIIFRFLCGSLKGFMKAFKGFIKPFEAPQRSVKIKIHVNFLSLSGIRTTRVKFDNIFGKIPLSGFFEHGCC